MRFNRYATRLIVAIVAIAITLPACTTAQLQKQYTSFDVCFREQKVIAMTVGAIGGALIGNAIGGNSKQKTVAAVGLAALGGVIGNRIAWESCLKAFSPRSQTTLVTARATSTPLAPPTSGGAPSAERYLTIQSVTARPLVLGRDL